MVPSKTSCNCATCPLCVHDVFSIRLGASERSERSKGIGMIACRNLHGRKSFKYKVSWSLNRVDEYISFSAQLMR